MNLQRPTFLLILVAALANTLFADDAERALTLEVQLNGATLSKTAFPLFNTQRGIIVDEPQKYPSLFHSSQNTPFYGWLKRA